MRKLFFAVVMLTSCNSETRVIEEKRFKGDCICIYKYSNNYGFNQNYTQDSCNAYDVGDTMPKGRQR